MTAGSVGDSDPGLSYEQAREALTEVVARLEAGSLTLEESLALWEQGDSLAKICRERLDGARERLAAHEAGRVSDGE